MVLIVVYNIALKNILKYIYKRSMPKLRWIVMPYMHESMLYKLGLHSINNSKD